MVTTMKHATLMSVSPLLNGYSIIDDLVIAVKNVKQNL